MKITIFKKTSNEIAASPFCEAELISQQPCIFVSEVLLMTKLGISYFAENQAHGDELAELLFPSPTQSFPPYTYVARVDNTNRCKKAQAPPKRGFPLTIWFDTPDEEAKS